LVGSKVGVRKQSMHATPTKNPGSDKDLIRQDALALVDASKLVIGAGISPNCRIPTIT